MALSNYGTLYRIQRHRNSRILNSQRIKQSTNGKSLKPHNFLGFYKLFDSSYKPFSKLLWSIIVISCFSICFYQIASRISIFLNGAIAFEVDMRPQTSFQFPSVTLCNPDFKIFVDEDDDEDNEFINITELWDELNIKELVVSHMGLVDSVKIDTVNMPSGICLMVTLEKQITYKGPFTEIVFRWLTDDLTDQNFFFFVHNNTFKHSYDGFLISEIGLMGHKTKFRIHAKEFIRLNTYRNPCMSAEEAHNCITNCLDAEVLKILTCNHPIVNSTKLKNCINGNEFVRNTLNINRIIYNMSYFTNLCQCKRKCNEIVYTLLKDIESNDEADDYSELRLLYADEKHETIREREIFPLSALLGDIGGMVSFYLGLSYFAVADVIDYLIRRYLL